MTFIFICLAVGGLIGYFRPPSKKVAKYVNLATISGLLILLVSMGAQIGSNEKVLSNLGQMGLSAFVLAGMSVLGSIIFVRLVTGQIEKKILMSTGESDGKVGEDN